jgi:hypothetical protein
MDVLPSDLVTFIWTQSGVVEHSGNVGEVFTYTSSILMATRGNAHVEQPEPLMADAALDRNASRQFSEIPPVCPW